MVSYFTLFRLSLGVPVIFLLYYLIKRSYQSEIPGLRRNQKYMMALLVIQSLGILFNMTAVISNDFAMPVLLSPNQEAYFYQDTNGRHSYIRDLEEVNFPLLIDKYEVSIGKASIGDFFIVIPIIFVMIISTWNIILIKKHVRRMKCKQCKKSEAIQWVLEEDEKKKLCEECLREFLDRQNQ